MRDPDVTTDKLRAGDKIRRDTPEGETILQVKSVKPKKGGEGMYYDLTWTNGLSCTYPVWARFERVSG